MEKLIKKYCECTNSKLVGYENGIFYFYDGWEEKVYDRKGLLREVSNFE